MLDGRLDPCCSSCRWSIPSDDSSNAVSCQRHQMEIHYPAAMFCTDLSHNSSSEPAAFTQENEIQSGLIYEWISGASDGDWYSYFPSFDKPYYPLATISEYRLLTSAAVLELIKANRNKRLTSA